MAIGEHPGIEQPMFPVMFPGGWHLSIEFTGVAPEDDQPWLGVWLELRTGNPEAVLRAALDAGFQRVEIQALCIYFMVPVGQVRSRLQAERERRPLGLPVSKAPCRAPPSRRPLWPVPSRLMAQQPSRCLLPPGPWIPAAVPGKAWLYPPVRGGR
jgi:hypothetical protein